MKQISITESTVAEAMAQIDSLESVKPRNKNCLRLLTEEMFSMINELLRTDKLDYQIECEDGKYTLSAGVKAWVGEDARRHFLSMSTDGRNAANRGIKGLLGAVIEAFYYTGSADPAQASWSYGICPFDGGSSPVWSLSQYISLAPEEKVKRDWDGMEKSIIANFADDVKIGVRLGRLEMAVTKTFANE